MFIAPADMVSDASYTALVSTLCGKESHMLSMSTFFSKNRVHVKKTHPKTTEITQNLDTMFIQKHAFMIFVNP